MKQQAMNPFLPIDTYIPDGEPHVFGDRIYLFGSHDTEGGDRYCAEDNYEFWSAPLTDLSDWSCRGVSYESTQSPHYAEGYHNDLYAPDVVQGKDGRYYLYHNIDGKLGTNGHNLIQVAVCDTPDGKYEYYGDVRNPDGSQYREYLDGDPAVLSDDGVIRLYHGWSLSMTAATAHRQGGENNGRPQSSAAQDVKSGTAAASSGQQAPQMPEPGTPAMQYALKGVYKMLFHREGDEVAHLKYPLMGANEIELADDMLTIVGEPHRIVPGMFDTPKDSSFYGHAFYEAASIRKIRGTYYFIYSSEKSNELCYATSAYPDRDFVFRGTIISNGDVGYNGRKDEERLNMTANNHGSLECVNGQWYIFYHRQTHNTTFSRQACAEKVEILPDGSIPQVECTSCGLNDGPMKAEGTYLSVCACNLTNGHMPHATNTAVNADIPFITHDADDRYITNIKNGTLIGFKYFDLAGASELTVRVRRTDVSALPFETPAAGKAPAEGAVPAKCGSFILASDEACSVPVGGILLRPGRENGREWISFRGTLNLQGVENPHYSALYLKYVGEGPIDLLDIAFA